MKSIIIIHNVEGLSPYIVIDGGQSISDINKYLMGKYGKPLIIGVILNGYFYINDTGKNWNKVDYMVNGVSVYGIIAMSSIFNSDLLKLSSVVKPIYTNNPITPMADNSEFPYERNEYLDKDQMFKNLLQYQPVSSRDRWLYKGDIRYININRRYSFISFVSQEDWINLFDGIADHYTGKQRMSASVMVRGQLLPSPMDCWDNRRDSILNEAKQKNDKPINILWYKCRWATRFRPSWAKGLISKFFSNPKGIKMLDISAGWGDRLIAAISLGMEYHGYDPNMELKTGHDAMISDYGDKNKQVIEYIPFETANVEEGVYDLVLSSPPYFNLEHYSDNNDQSSNKYPTYEGWLEGFLYPSLSKAFNGLKHGGIMMIHLSDIGKYNMSVSLCKYMSRINKAKYLGAIGLRGSDSRSTKPVWIWKKS